MLNPDHQSFRQKLNNAMNQKSNQKITQKKALKAMRLFIAGALCLSIGTSGLPGVDRLAAPVHAEAIHRDVIKVPNGDKKRIAISFVNASIREVLHTIAEAGDVNLIMDESVVGNVTVDLDNTTINEALTSVALIGNLIVSKQPGGIYLAITQQAADSKGLSRELSKVIRVRYANATRLAALLNQSVFANANLSILNATGMGGAGGGAGGAGGLVQVTKATADPRTNSVIIVGSKKEIDLAEAAITRLDKPRESKTFYLSFANAVDVASMLASSIFNDGSANFQLAGGGAGGGAGGAGAGAAAGGGAAGGAGAAGAGGAIGALAGPLVLPTTLLVEQQIIEDGVGINNFGNADGGDASAGLSESVILRGYAKESSSVNVSPQGVLIIPDSRQNAITLLGTAQQIALAESLIPTLDAQLPQVSIEASLIEITDTGLRELGTNLGISGGEIQSGFNNLPVEGTNNTSGAAGVAAGAGLVGLRTVDPTDSNSFGRSGIVFTTDPLSQDSDYLMQLRALVTSQKAKILANPTIVATHDSESIISIVDEVVRRIVTEIDESGFSTQTIELGEAGIVLDILPRVGDDGTISMRLRPSVTSVLSQSTDINGNLITLLSKRDVFTQNVRVKNGNTLVIGGLIKEEDSTRTDKMPGLGDLPIVGAMFRSAQKTGERSEIVLLITPHIISGTKLTPVNATQTRVPLSVRQASTGAY